MNRNLILVSSLLLLQFPVFAFESPSRASSQAAPKTSICEIQPEDGEFFSEKQQQKLASKITVKVTGDSNGGSGTLLAKQGNTYLVLTNLHVIRGVNSIRLQMADGKTYPAQVVPKTNFEKFDLALLQFQTNQNYCLAEVGNLIPDKDMPVLAAGFSTEKGEIVFRAGKVQQISDRPLKEGYQIGYTSDIEQGMSGGAIINSSGILLGINGKSAYPILNTGYTYQNGSRPSEEEIKEMRKLSWGIPVSTFLAFVNPEILTAYSLPLPATPPSVPVAQLTGWLGELEQKAKQITVRIDSSSNANGSGIIIAKDGNSYTVLTADHVVCEREDATKPCGNYNYQILAPDGKQYAVDKSTIKREEGVDLTVVKFTSNATYQVATLANYNPKGLDYVFTAGYPRLGNKSPWRFTMGQIADKEEGLLIVKDSDFSTVSSIGLKSVNSLVGGYELVYTNITYGGMSGGPVLDSQGRVIGIHGRTEAEKTYDEKTGDCGIAFKSTCQTQIGFSLGIPVSTFLGLATQLRVQLQKVENTRTPQLNAQKVESIQQVVLSADVSKGNATAAQWLERGNQLMRLGRYKEAVLAFDQAIKLKPSFVYLAYYGKGLASAADNKIEQTVAAFEQAVRNKSDFAAARRQLSIIYARLNQQDRALIAADKAIELQPKNPNAYLMKAIVLGIYLQKYTEVEPAIKEAIKLRPSVFAYKIRGIIYAKQKKWDLALADFNKAIDISPDDKAYAWRGRFYEEQKKWDLALADFNKVIDINPYDEAYALRGRFYGEQKKWDLALADFNKAIDINPQFTYAYALSGRFYGEQKKWDLALANFNKAIDINPQFAEAYALRGRFYGEQKKWDLALADFNKAIDINPQLADAYGLRGRFYGEQKKWDLALADFNKAIDINPQLADAYGLRGRFYGEQKKWDLALADVNKAIDINPQSADAYALRGRFYLEQKKWDLALADVNKVIDINPQFADAYAWRGALYTNQKKWDLALADLNKAIDINPQSADAYASRGAVYLNKGDKQKAIQDLRQAAQLYQAQNNSAGYELVMNFLKKLQQ